MWALCHKDAQINPKCFGKNVSPGVSVMNVMFCPKAVASFSFLFQGRSASWLTRSGFLHLNLRSWQGKLAPRTGS